MEPAPGLCPCQPGCGEASLLLLPRSRSGFGVGGVPRTDKGIRSSVPGSGILPLSFFFFSLLMENARSWTHHAFPPSSLPQAVVSVDGKPVRLQLCDTAGQVSAAASSVQVTAGGDERLAGESCQGLRGFEHPVKPLPFSLIPCPLLCLGSAAGWGTRML